MTLRSPIRGRRETTICKKSFELRAAAGFCGFLRSCLTLHMKPNLVHSDDAGFCFCWSTRGPPA